jgi:aminocarboxymuconate-semialdehyde decarboxylase
VKIDVHAHIYPKAYLEQVAALRRADTRLALGSQMIPRALENPKHWSVEQRLEDLDRASLDLQVLSLSIPNVYVPDREAAVGLAQMANDTFIELARTYPNRFRLFASVPLHFPEEALRELARVADAPEVAGIVLGANANGQPLNHPDFLPFYADLERRGLPFFMHPMCPPGVEAMQEFNLSAMAGYLFDSTLAALRLVFAGVFERHPRLMLIMPHTGAVLPYMLGRVQHDYETRPGLRTNITAPPEAYIKRFYFDTVSMSVPSLRLACELFGADHLVFGTDFPFLDQIERQYREIEQIGLSAEAEEGIFSGNALRLLRKLGKPHPLPGRSEAS